MVLGFSDFVQAPKAFKYVIFLGLLVGVGIPLDFLGLSFTLGEFLFTPFQWVLDFFGVPLSFWWFYILTWVVLLVLFVGWHE